MCVTDIQTSNYEESKDKFAVVALAGVGVGGIIKVLDPVISTGG